MSYDGASGLYTVFPKAKSTGGAGRARKPKKAKPPCTFGPRLANGRCPTKPRGATADARARARGIYQAIVPSSKRGGSGDLIAGAVGAKLFGAGAQALRRRILTKVGTGAAARVATLGTGAMLTLSSGAILAAALGSYFITKRLIDNKAIARADRAEQAFLVAQSYRDAREAAVQLNGGTPLSARQQADLAREFKAQLAALGLSTTNLKGL